MKSILLVNRARCKRCGDVIESTSVHDFVTCSCGAIFVDGGNEYARRGGFPEDFEDLSEWTFVGDDAEEPEMPEENNDK